ncbi:GDP-mannose 4,6-dehydratase, partial [bacterium]|nr:GDP-mannose 4,6-dehydratase [bacterium]
IGEVYNVGGGNEVSNIDLTKQILEFTGKPESYIEYVKDRPGHDKRYSLDCGKIKKLGWEPRHAFNTAFNSTLQWYMDNEWWWKKIKEGEFQEYYNKHYKDMHGMKKM